MIRARLCGLDGGSQAVGPGLLARLFRDRFVRELLLSAQELVASRVTCTHSHRSTRRPGHRGCRSGLRWKEDSGGVDACAGATKS